MLDKMAELAKSVVKGMSKMDIKQLKEYLDVTDFVFKYHDKLYFICPFSEFYSAGEANKKDTEYKTFDALLNDFMVEGKPLKDVLKDIEW